MRISLDRKKVNFMISKKILMTFYQIVPAGERSDFINKALDEAITRLGRQKASDAMDSLAEEAKSLKLSTKEFLKTRHDGLL